MKKNIKNALTLYPTPVTLVGVIIDEKPNWLEITHIGIPSHNSLMISCMKNHYSNKGFKKNQIISISLVNEHLLEKVDFIGNYSGNSFDKSNIFKWDYGKYGAPIPKKAPLTLECQIIDNYEIDNFNNYILRIKSIFVEEDKLNENGLPDYKKIAPILFEFPNYSYFSLGEKINNCRFAKNCKLIERLNKL